MLKKRIWLGGVLLLMIVVGAAYAVANNSFEISWWTVDGGGGTSEGDSYSVSGTAGQPDAGNQSGGDYTLGGGYWTSDKTQVFMPMIMKNFCGGFARTREREDNDTDAEANGPLCLFRTYIGNPDNDLPSRENDYYYFNWHGGLFTVTVSDYLTEKAQLIIYYQNVDDPDPANVGDQEDGTYIINYNGAAGKYLIRVVALTDHEVGHGDYTLRITTP